MRFALTKDHLDFFYRHHYIEFEELLSPDEVEALLSGIEEVLSKRIKSSWTPEAVYRAGYNIWSENPSVKKVALSSHLAEIASQLSKERTLRLAFDQVLYGAPSETPLFAEPRTLKTLSSVQPVICGLILTLKNDEAFEDPQPKKPGNATFFSPRHPLSFDYLSQNLSTIQYLIVYTGDKALYVHTPTDPHTHVLKKQSYVFGDRLGSSHPIVIKP
ncbi:MAG: hypothetical protein KDK64_01490 [Chlamydiia bacterium]|nr:hypothetical protein [Chlamydiia bacterium]